MAGLALGPKHLTAILGVPSRDLASIVYPISVMAEPFALAAGFGTAHGVTITSAILNGVPAMNIPANNNLGDIVAGSSSPTLKILFPLDAAARGSNVLLVVTFENSDGKSTLNQFRVVAP